MKAPWTKESVSFYFEYFNFIQRLYRRIIGFKQCTHDLDLKQNPLYNLKWMYEVKS